MCAFYVDTPKYVTVLKLYPPSSPPILKWWAAACLRFKSQRNAPKLFSEAAQEFPPKKRPVLQQRESSTNCLFLSVEVAMAKHADKGVL